MPIEIIVILVLLIILLLIIICNIKIVPQAQAYVMERLGAYHSTWGTGLHVKIPFVDRISRKVSLKEQVAENECRMIGHNYIVTAKRHQGADADYIDQKCREWSDHVRDSWSKCKYSVNDSK